MHEFRRGIHGRGQMGEPLETLRRVRKAPRCAGTFSTDPDAVYMGMNIIQVRALALVIVLGCVAAVTVSVQRAPTGMLRVGDVIEVEARHESR